MAAFPKQALVLSGEFGTSTNSARAGFVPISLVRAPLGAFEGIGVHLRTSKSSAHARTKETFALYCAADTQFSESHRSRLAEHGVKFVYIPIAEQARFRRQIESLLLEIVRDPYLSASAKSEILYETSVELMNELLDEPDLAAKAPRLERISRAVTMMVLNDSSTFSHLFAASHHDFYTATHMVNVATWMVPVAYAMGHRDPEELSLICQAGLLHDVGKIYIPSEILNKKTQLSPTEWGMIRLHPELGRRHLEKFRNIHPLIVTVTRQHHERLDGSGYPARLKGDQIHPISRICAVVDSYDAMTAFRPFKLRTMSVSQALKVIANETPARYDPLVFKAWLGLLQSAERDGSIREPVQVGGQRNGRRHERFAIDCRARLHILQESNGQWIESQGLQITAHNISRSGLGILSQEPLQPGERVRIHIDGPSTLRRTDEGLIVRCRSYRDGWYEAGIEFG